MSRAALFGAAAALVFAAAPAPAQELACGQTYVIQRGDTLQRVARRAYGPGASYVALWRFNRDRVATRDPSLIEVGQVIAIPCLDADGAPIPFEAEAEAEAGVGGLSAAEAVARTGAGDPAQDGGAPVGGGAEAAADETASLDPARSEIAALAAPGPSTPEPDEPQAEGASGEPAAASAPAPGAAPAAEQAAAPVDPVSGPADARDEPAPVGDVASTAADTAPTGAALPAAGASTETPEAAAQGVAAAAQKTAPEPAAPESAAAEPAAPAAFVLRLASGGGAADGPAAAVARAALALSLGEAGYGVVRGPGAGGLSLPLIRPDCPQAAALCDGRAWSAPLVERMLVVHVAAGRTPPATPGDLAGLRLCASADAPPAALALLGFPQAAITQPDALGCFAAVIAGEADAAVAEAADADAAMAAPQAAAAVAEAAALARFTPLRAAAAADDPQGRAALAALDAGLERLRASGRWLDAAASGLAP